MSTSWTSAETPSIAGSSILKEAPPFLFERRNTQHGGEDLSLSELYLDSEHSQSRPEHEEPFSLLPPSRNNVEDGHPMGSTIQTTPDIRPSESTNSSAKQSGTSRRDQLQRDLFVLKKLNASMSAYITALRSVSTATENVAAQVDRTEQLLNIYVDLLRETEKNSQLIFDESWQGGTDDMQTLTRLREIAAEREEKKRQERERIARIEREKEEREERERLERETKERRERERAAAKMDRATRGMRGIYRGRVQVGATSGRSGTSGIPAKTGTTSKRI